MYVELMDAASLHGYFSIFSCHGSRHAIHLNAHQSGLDPEVFRLKLMEMRRWPFRSIRTVDELAQDVWN